MNRIRGNKQGFTLVELTVVLLLISILFGIAGSSLYHYVHTANFKGNNESAQSVFSAVQSGLTHSKSNGSLEELDQLCQKTYERNGENKETFGTVDFDKLTVDDLEKPGIEKLKSENRNLYYVILNRKDYKNRIKEENLPDTVENRIYQMIEPYLYDKAVFDASICIEFDAGEGIVYSVSYAKKPQAFTYQSDSKEPLSIDNRTYDHRNSILLGYYYAGMLSARAPYDMEKPVVSNVSLVNDEMLTLQWNLSSAYQDLTGVLYYNIQIYDQETQQVRLSMTVNKSDVENNAFLSKDGTEKKDQTVTCTVVQYDETGKQNEEPVDYRFPAYVELTNGGKTPVMHLVLDAVDLQTQNSTTYSFSRFGIKNGEIFARVQAAGEGYRASAWKETNVSHMYMASSGEQTDGKQSYGIKNARHLYNLRFMEDELKFEELSQWSYVQHDSFAWGGSHGIISRGNVYNGGEPVSEKATDTAFPKIETLNEKASYQGIGSLPEIQYLTIKEEKKQNEIDESTGLFGKNYGAIENVSITNAAVEGANRTGIMCGTNMGSMKNIRTSGSVSGMSYVGGIAGQDGANRDAYKRTYEELVNEAKVTGKSHVGGIIGSIAPKDINRQTDDNQTKVINCENVGRIKGTVGYVGGIVGYNDQGHLENCNSTQIYTEEELKKGVEDLTGICVGGLIGYNRSGQMTDCSTGQMNQPGYVLGKEMVGGIVGYSAKKEQSQQPGSVLADTQEKSLDGKGQTNGTHVIGESYAGGIIGCNGPVSMNFQNANGKISIDYKVEPLPEEASANLYQIANWNNKGIVLAKSKYAGGIAGYNEGTLKDCLTRVNTASINGRRQLEALKAYGLKGNYIGGIAGYNSGTIESKNKKQVVSVLYGGRFIGGITGYNGPGGDIDSDYEIAGAYLDGEAFIGGYAGCNSSVKVLGKKAMQIVKISDIQGGYFIGSLFGANIINGSQEKDYNINAKIDSAYGEIKGTAFVGGVVGYTQITQNAFQKETQNDKEILEQMALDEAKTAWNSVKTLFAQDTEKFASVTIENQTPKLSGIEASVFVGGMVGYNANGSRITLKNSVNTTSIVANGELTGLNGISEITENYTFVGGIIGYARYGVTIDDCANAATADIKSTKGNYLGALTAVNGGGEIQNCTTRSFGSSKTDKIGGLAGINTQSGIIDHCTVEGQVRGNSNVGGLVAYNDSNGQVMNPAVKGKIKGEGDNVGGISAVNQGQIINATMHKGSVRGDGKNIGGMIGKNIGQGQLIGKVHNTDQCSVQGNNNVGGFVGFNEINNKTKKIIQAKNHAKVAAEKNYAGGIVGGMSSDKLADEVTVLNECENYGEIRTNGEGGYAGGITSVVPEKVTIEDCVDQALVLSSKGTNGGIAAVNKGTIKKCETQGEKNDSLPLRGGKNVGGIAGINKKTGEILESKVRYVVLSDIIGGSKEASIGGITGQNDGNITACTAGEKEKELMAGSYVGEGNTGGITGINNGTIASGVVFATLDFQGNTKEILKGNVGGIAGTNESEITECSYQGHLKGYTGDNVGYGGIAGINKSQIKDCKVGNQSKAEIDVSGSANSDVKVGGIAGINRTDAKITNAYLGEASIKTSYGFVGGIAGWNYGKISECGMEKKEDQRTVSINLGQGHIGGILGKNEEGGSADYVETGSQWTIKATNHATDNTIGGIIGYNCSGEDMSGLKNHAIVTKNTGNVVGGIIGRQEVTSNNTWILSNCENDGAISGYDRVGGIIGQWKYKGGTLSGCINKGEVKASNTLAAGIVGYLYLGNDGDTMRLTKCENHGTVVCAKSSVAGIMGQVGGSNNKKIFLSQCINSGDLNGNTVASGMIGTNSEGNTKIYFNKCQNYGKKAGKTETLYGMSASSLTGVKECFAVSDHTYPMDKSTEIGNFNKQFNYYFSNKAEQSSNAKYLSVTAPYASNEPKNLLDGTIAENSRWDYKNPTGTTTWNNAVSIEVKFVKAEELHKVTTYWYAGASDNGKRKYDYQLYYQDASGIWNPIEGTDGKRNFQGTGWIPSQVKNKGETVNFNTVKAYGYKVVVNKVNYHFASLYEMEINGEKNSPNAMIQINNLPFKVESGGAKAYHAHQDIIGATIDLSANPIGYKGSGNQLYKDVHSEIYQFYYDSYKDKPGVPQNIKLTETGGNYQVSWDEVKDAYSYQVELYVADNADMKNQTLLKTMEIRDGSVDGKISALFESKKEWQSKYVRAKVIAYNYDKSLFSENWSDSLYVKQELPVPQVHYELTGTQEEKAYDLILDNPEAYRGIQNNVQITVNIGGKQHSFTVSDGKMHALEIGTNDRGAIQITMKAEPTGVLKDTYRTSAEYKIQTTAKSMDVIKNTRGNDANFRGFYGNTPMNLFYQMEVRSRSDQNSAYQWYERQEILMDDPELNNLPVVVSSGEIRVSSSHTVDLKNLPESIADAENVKVRAYPWATQNHTIYFGHMVDENLTKKEVLASEAIENGVLKEGYIIEADDNGTYTIRYSIILGKNEFSVQRKETTTKIPQSMEKPSLECKKADRNTYEISWDKESDKGIYQVLALGILSDGEMIELYSKAETTDHSAVIDDVSKCVGIQLEVTRIGETQTDGKTVKLGAKTVETFKLHPAMDSIQQPKVVLADRDDLNYKVSWEPIADTAQIAQLKGYRIVITDISGKVLKSQEVSKDITQQQMDLEQIAGQTVNIYIQAMADSSGDYSDSELDYAYELNVAKRLEQPDTDIITISREWKENDAVTYLSFVKNGVTLNVLDSDDSVSYLVDAKIMDESGKVLADFGQKNQTDADKRFYLNEKLEEWNADAAGQYLKIRIRKTAPDAISSKWSEEKTFRLPRVKLDSLSVQKAMVKTEVTETMTVNGISEMRKSEVGQDAVLWSPSVYADVYNIVLTENNKDETKHQILLRKLGTSWQVKVLMPKKKDADGKVIEPTWTTLTAKEDKDKKLWTYTGDDLSYEKKVHIANGNLTYDTTLKAYLTITEYQENQKTEIAFVFPDAESYHEHPLRHTKEARFCPMFLGVENDQEVILKDTPYYSAGNVMQWIRTEKTGIDGDRVYGIEIKEQN